MNKWLALLLVVALAASDVDAKSVKRKKDNKGTNQFITDGPYFSIPIVIGSQKTKLRVGVEGMYGASVFYGKGMTCNGMKNYCVPRDSFDYTSSSSFKMAVDPDEFTFSSGNATGFAGNDDLSIGSLTLKDTMFGIARNIPSHLNRYSDNSGHLAMNSPVTLDSDKTTMQKFAEQASKPTITFYAPT